MLVSGVQQRDTAICVRIFILFKIIFSYILPLSSFMTLSAVSIIMLADTPWADFPGGSEVKNPPANAGDAKDAGSTLGSERSPGEENDNPLQCSCLGTTMDRRAWRATVHGVA